MRTVLAIASLIVLIVAACGTASSPSPTPAAASVAPPAAVSATPQASAPAAGGAATVMVTESELGQILVDGEGRTLYGFTNDTGGTPSCYETCAENWPPLLAEGEITVGEGLDDSDFSTAARTDGGEQVKIGDFPLYYFANDAAAGDTNGQGVGDVWFVVSPSGELIR